MLRETDSADKNRAGADDQKHRSVESNRQVNTELSTFSKHSAVWQRTLQLLISARTKKRPWRAAGAELRDGGSYRRLTWLGHCDGERRSLAAYSYFGVGGARRD